MLRRCSDADFARESDAHLALETDRLIAEGMSPAAARALAIARFRNPVAVAERFYESRRIAWVDHARQDLVHAWRSLACTPGFTLIAVLTLAFGVAATTLVATNPRCYRMCAVSSRRMASRRPATSGRASSIATASRDWNA